MFTAQHSRGPSSRVVSARSMIEIPGKSYVNNLDEIDQNDQISLLLRNNKLSLNATVFFIC